MLNLLKTYRSLIRFVQFIALFISVLFLCAYVIISHLPEQEKNRVIFPFLLADLSDYGFPLLLLGLLLACFTTGGYLRLLPVAAFIFGIPPLLILLYLMEIRIGIPHPLVEVTLQDGRRFMLASDPIPTDAVFSLWQADTQDGQAWRRVDRGLLKYSENGDWLGSYRLVATADQKRLLVRRGGIWTDCLELQHEMRLCDGTVQWLDWQNRESWQAESDAIQRLTGLSPK